MRARRAERPHKALPLGDNRRMRIFGLIGLVFALVLVGVLVKRQIGGIAAAHGPAGDGRRAQSQQIQEQVKQSLDAAMQQRRAMPDDN